VQQKRPPLLAKDNDVRVVAETLRPSGTARTLLLTGSPGVGKSAVLEAGRQTAVLEGVKVLRLGWESAEGAPGAPALADAVCHLLTRIHDGRLPARITDIRRVELRTAGGDGGLALLAAMGRVLADAAHHIPFALIVEDTERMPPATASGLALMLRAFRPAGVPVVMAGRLGTRGQAAGELVAAADRVLTVEPLGAADVQALVEQRFAGPADAEVARAVMHSLGPLHGNPRAVLSVLGALEEDGGLLQLDGWVHLATNVHGLRLGGSLTELCRVAGLGLRAGPEQPEFLFEAAHLIGTTGLVLDDVHGMARWAPEQYSALTRIVDRLVVEGVLAVGPVNTVAFAAPALGAALRALSTPPAVQTMCAGIALAAAGRRTPSAAGADQPQLAEHVAAAGGMVADEIAAPLLLAAAAKSAGQTTDRAVRAYLAALRHMPARERSDRARVLRAAAELAMRKADIAGAVALGEPLSAAVDGGNSGADPELEAAGTALGLAALVHHLPPGSEGDQPWAAVLRTPAGAELAALSGRYGIGPVLAGPDPDTAVAGGAAAQGRARGSRARGAGLAVAAGAGASVTAAPAGGSPGVGLAECAPEDGLLLSPGQLRLLAAASAGPAGLEAAGAGPAGYALGVAAVDAMAAAAAYGDLSAAVRSGFGDSYLVACDSTAARYHAMVRAYLAGDWAEALVCARRTEALARSRGMPHAGVPVRVLAAEIHLASGELGRAQSWMSAVPDTVAHPLAGRVRMGVRYRSGHPTEAYEGGWRDVRRAREAGLLEGLDHLLLRIFHCAVQDDAPPIVRRAVAELASLYEESASPRTGEILLMARSVLARDLDGTLAALRLIKERGDRPLALMCHEWVAMLSDDPRPWLSAAVREAHALGIRHIERSTFGRAARVSGLKLSLPRRRPAREGLSEWDRRLVAMVSDGATNRQIAARLTCSEKTVEQHLTRLFRLCGCRSRAELVAARLDGSLARLGLPPDMPTWR
jgi:DNA-binding CsgD family transcriptional regulator